MRAIWKGNISFALVTIPISLFSATKRNEISLHYLHKKDLSAVSYKRFCDTEEIEVPWDEITRGYEYEKGQYVEITDGIKDGDNVVVDGNFLIDAESNLSSALKALSAPAIKETSK